MLKMLDLKVEALGKDFDIIIIPKKLKGDSHER